MGRELFTSALVTKGYPDKIHNQISDIILDVFLKDDPESRLACEVATTTDMIFIFEEISSNAAVNFAKIAGDVVRRIGHTSSKMGFDADTCSVVTAIGQQACNISQGVNHSSDSGEIGVGDQGMVFGYACDETHELMPLSIFLAHKFTQKLSDVRKNGEIAGLKPDGKMQVTIEYDDDKPIKVDTIVVFTQYAPEIDMIELKKLIFEKVVIPTIPFEYYEHGLKLYVNPTKCFEIGGAHEYSGLAGRKIIVDTYDGYSRHDGAFSGKAPAKMDRSVAYMARYIAKNIVAAGIARRCEIQISYTIGISNPISIHVDTFGTSEHTNDIIKRIVENVFDLRHGFIIDTLDLKRPIYTNIACYGHMGRTDIDLPWEKTDKIGEIHHELKIIMGTRTDRI